MDVLSLTQTPLLVLLNLLIILLIHFNMRNAIIAPFYVQQSNRYIAIILMFVFILFSFWGADWFQYCKNYYTLREGIYNTNLEDIYQVIANISSHYLIFRLYIWGTGLVLLLMIFRRLPINFDLAIFFFGSSWIIWFGYARVSLAMALMFYGVSLIFKPIEKIALSSKILGIGFIFCSFYFHKSAFFGIIIIILANILKNVSNIYIKFFLILMPLILFVAQNYVGVFMSADIDSEAGDLENFVASGQNRMGREVGIGSIGGGFMEIFEKVPYYILAFLCYKFHYSEQYDTTPKVIRIYIKILLFLVLVSSVFAFDLGVNTKLMYTRFMRFCFIPATIVLTYFYQISYNIKWTKIAYKTAFLSTMYAILYITYTRLVNG